VTSIHLHSLFCVFPTSLLDSSAGAPGASGFNFLQPAAGPPAATSFSFLSAPVDAPAPADPAAHPVGSTGFSFLSAPAPVPPAPDAGGRRPSASAVPAGSIPGALQPGALPVVVQPAVVKKRKTGFRVGVAREDAGAGGGVLAGLQVHGADDAGDGLGDEEQPAAHTPISAAPPQPLPALAPTLPPAVGSGMLAGLHVHGATLTEPSSSGPSVGGVGGGSMLAGLQVHDPPESPGTSSPGVPAAAAAAARAPPVVAPPIAEPESDGGVFAGLMTKVSAGSAASGGAKSTDASGSWGRAGAPAPPPRSLSPTSRKRAVIAELDGAARKLRVRLAEIKQKLRASVEADKKVSLELSAVRDRLAQKEAEQDDAIRHERFEAAEALNAAIEDARTKVARCEQQRRQIAGERAALEAEQEAAFAESLAASSDAVMGLKRYADDREHTLHVFGREALTRLTTASDRIANDEEQLRLKEEHVRLETKLVDEETQQVHRAITDQTDELNAQVRVRMRV
jgi:regulator of replication initiation timing